MTRLFEPGDPEFNRHIEDETKEILAEGKRRQRLYEGIDLEKLKRTGACIGTHKMPSIEEVEQFWTDGTPAITTHTPTLADLEGLANEVNDLERDADLMRKWIEVDYGK